MPVQCACPVILHWTEEGGVQIKLFTGSRFQGIEIFRNEPLGCGMRGNKANLVALTFDSEMHHSLAALQIAQAQQTQLLAPDTVIEQGGKYRAIPYTLRVSGAGASSSRRACASPRAGVLPSFLFAGGRYTPSTGFPATALCSQR